MPVYKFAFAPDAAGLTATIKNFRTGSTVDTGALSGSADADGVVTYKPTLAEGIYSAEVEIPGQAGLAGEEHQSRTRMALGTLDIPASIEAAPGGGTTTNGLGAYFFGGVGLEIPLTHTRVYCPLVIGTVTDRSPQRDDLMVIDPDDDTKLNVVTSGLYDVTVNTPLRLSNDFATTDTQDIICDVQLDVNDGVEAPSDAFNNRAYWTVAADAPASNPLPPPIALNITHPQVLLAGDVVRLAFRVTGNDGLGDPATGSVVLNPDITFMLTYRGPVS